jgi:AraC-like DNA-binding protein
MKKTIIITAIALSSLTGKAQESTTKLKLYAANAGMGIFNFQKKSNEVTGLTLQADVTFSLSKNLFSASYITGEEFAFLQDTKYNFNEFSLLYGREWNAANWFKVEGFAGVGYYTQRVDDQSIDVVEKDNTVAVPLRVNAKFYFTKKFGLGLCTNYSINSLANNFSESLIFHYRFN